MQLVEHEGAWWAQLARGKPHLDRNLGPFETIAEARTAAEAAWLRYCAACAGFGSIKKGAHAAFGFIYCVACLGWERRSVEDGPNDGRLQEAYIAWRKENP